MLATYTFNSDYRPQAPAASCRPSLRLLEGGKFAPEAFAPVVVQEDEQSRLRFFRWGLVPSWTQDLKQRKRQRLFAPAHQVFQHPLYSQLVRQQRCLIPADGFYLEQTDGNRRRIFKATLPQGETFCFAGLYDCWQQPDGSLLYSFTLLTTGASESFEPFGLQMPLIFPANVEATWLNPHTPEATLRRLLSLKAPKNLQLFPVEELRDTEPMPYRSTVAA
jgi:putative SOS response-associated peptidase YedK